MKIKEMTATFGRLKKAHLKLSPGLNILEGPNEGGKSTWSAFIRAMLYGVPTNQRDKAGFLAEKNRYQPWSGVPMEGSMTVEWQGREVILRRRAKGSSPFGQFEAVDAATGEPVSELTAENVGQTLIGCEREVFERSAFVGQANLAVDGAPALEKRIAALLTSGTEVVSYSQVERQLKDWLNRRKHNKTGLIPKLEAEIEEQTILLGRFAQARRQREEGLAQLEQLREEKNLLEQEKGLHKARAEAEKWTRYEQSAREYLRVKEEYDVLAVQFQNLPAKEELLQAQQDYQQLQALAAALRLKEDELRRVEQTGPEEVELPRFTAGNGVVCALCAIAAAVVFFLLGNYVFAIDPVTSDSALITDLTRRPMDPGTLQFVCAGLGALVGGGFAALITRLRKGGQKNRRAEEKRFAWEEDVARCRREAGELSAEREERLKKLLMFVHRFSPTVTNEFGVSAALSRALQGEDLLAPVKEKLEGARRVVQMAKANLDSGQKPAPVTGAARYSYQETVARLAVTTEELTRKERMVAAAEGELRTLGDPDEAEARLETLREELARRNQEYDAIALALKTMEQANAAMQARFSPELNRRAGEELSALTGGRYDKLTLKRTFEALAGAWGEVLPRNVLSLSQGTADQLYLAVRLAVCDLTLPRKDPAPMVLDDALANFDDERMALALERLLERSREQQVLLFTCHSREAAWAVGKQGVECQSILP